MKKPNRIARKGKQTARPPQSKPRPTTAAAPPHGESEFSSPLQQAGERWLGEAANGVRHCTSFQEALRAVRARISVKVNGSGFTKAQARQLFRAMRGGGKGLSVIIDNSLLSPAEFRAEVAMWSGRTGSIVFTGRRGLKMAGGNN